MNKRIAILDTTLRDGGTGPSERNESYSKAANGYQAGRAER